MPDFEPIIGLEVHAQMNTKSKMFCSCDNDAFEKPPNTAVCPICMGHPGTLPVPNGEAIKKAAMAAIAIGCEIQEESHFDRKHYFYPDLPPGFQISQYDFPLAKNGEVTFKVDEGNKTCRITRLHIENDAGKLTHRGNTTLCDFNRAGTPLMEIVTEPDLRSPREAVAFAQELRRMLIAVNSSSADMFKGMMRFDASISIREKGSEKLNPRSEIKNLNSFKSLEKALTYEFNRLVKLYQNEGCHLKHDITVGWLDDEEKTRLLRDKETAMDYRYFPEPDIPPMSFTKEDIESLKDEMPALPSELKKKYANLGLEDSEVNRLIGQPKLREIFDAVFAKTNDAKRSSSIVLTQLMGFLNAGNKQIEECPPAHGILELIEKIDGGTISANAGKEVLEKMVLTGKSACEIIREEGLGKISAEGLIEELVQNAIKANPKAVESYKAGKTQALGAIVGWIMKESKGQADPEKVIQNLKFKI